MEENDKPLVGILMIPTILCLYIPNDVPHLKLFKWFYNDKQLQEFATNHSGEIKQVIQVQKQY